MIMSNIFQYYDNPDLGKKIKQLEDSVLVENEEIYFKNKVNTSTSKFQPYYRWTRYREGYSGELVKELIRRSKIVPEKHFVLDPMCGSGSTQIAAAELGFDSLGLDVNIYAVDLSNSKFIRLNEIDIDQVTGFVKNLKLSNIEAADNTCCNKYFNASNYAQVIELKRLIEKIKSSSIKKFLYIAWLAILEECSNRKKDGNGLATRPSKIFDVVNKFNDQITLMLEDVKKHPLNNVTSLTVLDSASSTSKRVREFEMNTGKSLGTIIFSPPYANSFDYFESYKLELLCGYYSPDELISARSLAVRNYRKGYHKPLTTTDRLLNLIIQEIRVRIPKKEAKTGNIDNRSRLVPNLIIGYFQDMENIISEFSKSMSPGSQCYIVVDQSSYLGVIVPTDLIFVDIARKYKFTAKKVIHCRKAATSGQQLREYPYLKTNLRESIVVLEKELN